jgi:hypothetical protein
MDFQCFAWPDVAQRDTTKSSAVGRPDRREAGYEDVPEGCKGNATTRSVCDGLRFEEICSSAALKSEGQDGIDVPGARDTSTYNVARPSLNSEKCWVALECMAQVD